METEEVSYYKPWLDADSPLKKREEDMSNEGQNVLEEALDIPREPTVEDPKRSE